VSRKKVTQKWQREFDDALLTAGYRHHYQFADAIGWEEGALSKFYNGRRDFPHKLISRACAVLGLNGDAIRDLLRVTEPAEVK